MESTIKYRRGNYNPTVVYGKRLNQRVCQEPWYRLSSIVLNFATF